MNTAASASQALLNRRLWHQAQALKQGFLQLSQTRLSRLHEALTPAQQGFLQLLPLLLHDHHPQLPGYINDDVPHGIVNYQPSRSCCQQARQFGRSYRHRSISRHRCEISAVYLMGSSGSMLQSSSSDLDIWLCHAADLPAERQYLLQQKGERISAYAATLGLEVHCFTIQPQHFSAPTTQGLSQEHCGSSQRFLLLDEFYRSHIWLAGAYLAWWLVPPATQAHYDLALRRLYASGRLNPTDFIDFGPVATITEHECISAGLWQLYKGIRSPYKSILKLMLLELYQQQQPLLSTVLKQAILENRLQTEHCDPYGLLYAQAETYLLSRHEHQRLQPLRICLYCKMGIALSRTARHTAHWRRQLLQQMVNHWQWSPAQCQWLDQRKHWDILHSLRHRRALMQELTQGYALITQLSQTPHGQICMRNDDLRLLMRKLHTYFDNSPQVHQQGKLPWLNIGQQPLQCDDTLVVHWHQDAPNTAAQWLLFSHNQHQATTALHSEHSGSALLEPVYSGCSIVAALGWAQINGLLVSRQLPQVYTQYQTLNARHIRGIIDTLETHLPHTADEVPAHAFQAPAYITQVLLFINVGIDPYAQLTQQHLYKLSDRNDALAYGALRDNLVQSVDMLLRTTHHEHFAQHFDNHDGLLQALGYWLQQLVLRPVHAPPPQWVCVCYSATKGQAIAARIDALCQALYHWLRSCGESARFLFALGNALGCIQRQAQQFSLSLLADRSALLRQLGQPSLGYNPVTLDRYCLHHCPDVALMLSRCSDQTITVFFVPKADHTAVYCLDYTGTLSHWHSPLAAEIELPVLAHCLRLLDYQVHTQQGATDMASHALQCYELINPHAAVRLKPKTHWLQHSRLPAEIIDLQVHSDVTRPQQPPQALHIQGMPLTTPAPTLEQAVQHICRLPRWQARQPVCITALQHHPTDQLTSRFTLAQALHYRATLTQQLYQALRQQPLP